MASLRHQPATATGSPRTGVLLFLCALCAFASYDAFCKHMLETFSAPLMNLTRYTSVCVIALCWLASESRRGVEWRLWRQPHKKLLVARSVSLAIVALCFMTALVSMPLAEATAIYFTSPLIMVALSAGFLHERVGPAQWIAVAVGFAGMLLIVRPGADLPLAGTLLMAVSAVCYAVFQVLTRRLSGLVPPSVQYSYMALFSLIITGAPALGGLPAPLPSPAQLLLMLAGGACSGLAQFLLLAAYHRAQASLLAPLNYLQLLLAVLISTFWFSRPPDAIAMLGIALIIAGGSSLALNRGRQRPIAGPQATPTARQP